MKSVFEPELEGDSILVWEAGIGHRIIYPNKFMANSAYNFLDQKSRSFYTAKKEIGVYAIQAYGDDMTPYEFVRRFLSVATSAGLRVMQDNSTRAALEYW